MPSRDFEKFLQLLYTYDHAKALALYDSLITDEANFWPIADALLLVCANHQDAKLTVPHGLQTVEAARAMFALAGPEASQGLLRFMTLYSFSLIKRDWTATYLQQQAAVVAGDPEPAFWTAVSSGQPDRAAALACAVATQKGLAAASHALLRASLADLGRLAHNFTLAASYAEAARTLGMPGGLVPLANGAHFLATTLQAARPFRPEAFEAAPPTTDASLENLQRRLSDGEYETVHDILRRRAAGEDRERAFEPLLIGVAKDPGFLGHNMILAHSARLAAKYLDTDELSHVLWKFYRTLGKAYEYPADLAIQRRPNADPQAAITGLKSTLQNRTPPPLATIAACLEAGVPLDGVLKQIVGGYSGWRVGEKEHTIIYLNAAIQTANFLGEDKALLPLTVALQQLPF
ncbi:MAG TPA: hypothetical protein VEM95_00190 [Thermoplasmata archaeon]|nr:hypothetical protein [Thermoplasmata archaeon]